MRKKYIVTTIIILIFSLLLVACSSSNPKDTNENDQDKSNNQTVDNSELEELKEEMDDLKKANEDLILELGSLNNPSQQQGLIYNSLQVMEALKDKDYQELSNHVHPTKGVRFSPYFFVDSQNNQLLTAQDIENLNQNNTVLNWGSFDGSGDPIDLDFNDYYDRFIYDEDYINPHIMGINTAIGMGNIIDNVSIEYPDGDYVEYHLTGFDQQYDGMDWRSLRLIFEEDGGIWYLVGIVHGEWTI